MSRPGGGGSNQRVAIENDGFGRHKSSALSSRAVEPQSQSVGSFVADRDDGADRTSPRRTDRNTLVANRNAVDLEPARGVNVSLLASAADLHHGRSNGRAAAAIDDPPQDGPNETIGGRAHSIQHSLLEVMESEVDP